MSHRARGQTFALAAVAMVAAVGAAAMVVDMGMFWVVQRQFQAASDAAALAGAWFPPVCQATAPPCSAGSAETIAEDVAHANADPAARLCGGSVSVTAIPGGATTQLNLPLGVNVIVVTVECDASHSLGQILGLPPMHVSASSAAALGDRVACPAYTSGTPTPGLPTPTPTPPGGNDITNLTAPESAPCPYATPLPGTPRTYPNPNPPEDTYVARLIQ